MNADFSPDQPSLTPAQELQIEEVCTRFEAAWKEGKRPRIEDFLFFFRSEPACAVLLGELLALELTYRRQNSEVPTATEYQQRFPGHDFHAVFQRVAAGRPTATLAEQPGQIASAPWGLPPTSSVADPALPSVAGPALGAGLLPPPPAIAGYEILGILGRGGMGVVYKARHLALKRVVALKMIVAGAHAQPHQIARFLAEAQAVARLQHPNIVQIHEIGQQDGLPFFSLEFVPGGSLDKYLAGTPQNPKDAARLVLTLAKAMQAAHDAGIIHRDLKPANVLLASGGRQPPGNVNEPVGSRPPLADLTPKITDFGLAKQLDSSVGQTQPGAIMGTPSYMAPEQAAGNVKAIGPAADVYALGAILYELLAGRPPFRGASLPAMMDQILHVPPHPLQPLNPHVDPELEDICRKCLQKEPQKRYPSALELAADLLAYLEGRPKKDRSITIREQIARLLSYSGKIDPLMKISRLYYLEGAFVFTCWVGIFFLTCHHGPEWLFWSTLAFSNFTKFIIYCWHPRPTTGLALWAHRQWWSLWIAQTVSSLLLCLAHRLAGGDDYVAAIQAAYPAISGVIAVAFFGMGSVYWGRHYVFGLLFLALIVPAALLPTWAPLGFAVLGLFTCIEIARSSRHFIPSGEKNI